MTLCLLWKIFSGSLMWYLLLKCCHNVWANFGLYSTFKYLNSNKRIVCVQSRRNLTFPRICCCYVSNLSIAYWSVFHFDFIFKFFSFLLKKLRMRQESVLFIVTGEEKHKAAATWKCGNRYKQTYLNLSGVLLSIKSNHFPHNTQNSNQEFHVVIH